MISKEEVKKLADMARMEVGDSEQEKLADEMDAILGYVGQVKSITQQEGAGSPPLVVRGGLGGVINVLREDADPIPAETSNQELIAEFPEKEGNYLKVKKIL